MAKKHEKWSLATLLSLAIGTLAREEQGHTTITLVSSAVKFTEIPALDSRGLVRSGFLECNDM